MPRKESRRKERRKNGSGQKAKPSTPTQAIDAHMGEEKRNRKQKEEQKKKQGADLQSSYLGKSVASYGPYGSYGGPILKTLHPHPQGVKSCIRTHVGIMFSS